MSSCFDNSNIGIGLAVEQERRMTKSFSIVVMISLALGLSSTIAMAKLSEELGTEPNQLETLTNDASRAALFSRIRGIREEEIMAGPDDRAKQLVGKSGRFIFPFDARFDGSATNPRKNSIFGIDISHHVDPSVPFPRLSESKVSFVYAKATQGTRFKDGKFELFWKTLGELPQNQKIHLGHIIS
jgi:lysozyme